MYKRNSGLDVNLNRYFILNMYLTAQKINAFSPQLRLYVTVVQHLRATSKTNERRNK